MEDAEAARDLRVSSASSTSSLRRREARRQFASTPPGSVAISLNAITQPLR